MSMAADHIRSRFLEELTAQGLEPKNPRETSDIFTDTLADSSGVHERIKVTEFNSTVYWTTIGFIYPHIWSDSRKSGFWGLRKTIIETLQYLYQFMGEWYVVLLVGREMDDRARGTDFVADGFIIPGQQLNLDSFSINSTGEDYKVHERGDLEKSSKILSIQEVARSLTEYPIWGKKQ